MALTGYRGSVNGSIQTTYQDQPGVGVPGMLMYAPEAGDKIDSIFVGETNGVGAGKGVQLVRNAESVTNFQTPNVLAYLPDGDESAAEFGGIVVWQETMQTDSSGNNIYAAGRVARILKPGAVGGPIYVAAKDEVIPGTSTVNWVIAAGSDGKYEVGDFAPGVLNSGTVGTTVALTNAAWVTAGDVDGIAGIELFGNIVPLLDASI